MKSMVLILALILSGITFGQTLSEDFERSLKSDNSKTFNTLLNEDNLNTCFEAGNSNYTLLALTIKFEAKTCFESLLEKKVDIEKACSSKTPLMYAVKYGNLEMTKAIIIEGAKLGVKNSSGRTALDYAKKYKQKEVYDYLKSL